MIAEQLEIIDLSHKYKSYSSVNNTLNSINLKLSKGELVGLVGPSGCGKTTLLRIIAGFESPCNGRIVLNGSEISNSSRTIPPEKRGIGMVFQDYALFPHLTVWQNICFGLTKRSNYDRTNWLVELLGLKDFVKRFPHELSGGQRQRIALARALAPGNSIVLLDEPFNSLDVQVRMKLRTELSEVLKTFSATGIFVTHDSQEALSICDRVAVMRDGQLHQCGSAEELIRTPKTSFVGEFVFQKNIFPIQFNNNVLSTPLGSYSLINSVIRTSPDYLMFDSDVVELDFNSPYNCIVKSREYHHSHWIITVKFGDFFIRVSHAVGDSIKIGDSCCIRFIHNKDVLLFPGTIPAVIGQSLIN